MKLWKFLVPVLLGMAVMVVMVGCESGKKDESANIPAVERSSTPKYEQPTKTADGFALPENAVLEGDGPLKEVER